MRPKKSQVVFIKLCLHSVQGHNTTYWHNWWNQLSHFQKQVIPVMSVVDDWWSGLSEGQKTVTGQFYSENIWYTLGLFTLRLLPGYHCSKHHF